MPSNYSLVTIKQVTGKKTLSKAQKQFNSLTKQITEQQQLLVEWQTTIPAYNQRVVEEYQTLLDKYNATRLVLAQLFDRAYEDQQFKKTDKNKLAFMVREIISDLIAKDCTDDKKALYNKYSRTDYDTEKQKTDARNIDFMNLMTQSMFNMDLPSDFDMNSPEKIEAFITEQLLAQEQKLSDRQNKRKKTPKQLEKEAKLIEQEKNLSKSIQVIYRQLVKTLHPDREQDLAERERKTELMQRVNIAYAKKDLLRLFELQIEIEQINQTQLNSVSEENLKYYNTILKKRLNDLWQELEEIEMPFKARMSLSPLTQLTPNQLIAYLDKDIKSF